MSYEIIDPRVFSEIANKMDNAAHHPLLDINSVPVCRNMTREEIESIVKRWHQLNIEGSNLDTESALQGPSGTLHVEFGRMPITPFQFLKACKHLVDQIPEDLIKAARPLSNEETAGLYLLNIIIIQTMERIVESLPKYQDATLPF